MSRQRSSILVLILVPAVVSLAVTLLVLTFWNNQQEPEYIMLPTHSGTALVPPRSTRPVVEEDGQADGGEQASMEEPGDSPQEVEPTIVPGCENPVHVVAGGQTLGAIAELYGVTIDDITTINLMADPEFNPNFLSIDQEIIIPECGIPTPTPEPTATPTGVPTRNVPTPIPTSTDPPPGVVVVEIARVLNSGDITAEAVEIINRGSSVARLGEWRMVNADSEEEFTFPPLNLFPQGAVTVHTGTGEDTAIDVYWGLDEAAWLLGDTVQLYDSEGELQHEFVIEEGE